MSNLHSLEIVGCGCETQIQVGENLNHLELAIEGLTFSCKFNFIWNHYSLAKLHEIHFDFYEILN